MTELNLDEYNTKSVEEIRKKFSTIKLSQTHVEFTGTFHKHALEPNRIAKSLAYLPKHVQSAVFRGMYVYEKDSYQERDGSSPNIATSAGFRTVAYCAGTLGNCLLEDVASLPSSITQLAFMFSTNDAYERGYTIATTDLQQICNALPPSVTDFSLSGMISHIHPSNISGVLRLLQHVTHLYLENMNHLKTSPSSIHKDIFQSLHPNLYHLSLAICDLYKLTTFAFLTFFEGLSQSKLRSLNLGFNQLAKKPFREICVFLSHLPAQLISLQLAGNNLALLGWEKLCKLFVYLPKNLKYIDLSNNKLLNLPSRELKFILHSLSANITSLRLCDITSPVELPIDVLIEKFISALPKHMDSLDFSNSKLLGRDMAEFAKLISKLPETVKVLDFSDNDLSSYSKEDLIELFSKVPKHIRKIKLNRNGLSNMEPTVLEEVLSHLPGNIEIDVSDNGFEALPYTHLNHMLNALPDGIFHFNKSSLSLKNNGSLVSFPFKNNFFKPDTIFRHQKTFSNLQLILVQLIQQIPLNLDILQRLIPFLVSTTATDLYHMMQQVEKTNALILAKKRSVNIHLVKESKKTIQNRIKALEPDAKEIDLSFCAMYRINSIEQIAFLRSLPNSINKVKLKFNGFLNYGWSKKDLIAVLKNLPSHIHYVDLSGNGFEKMDDEELKTFLSALPAGLLISLNHEKPLTTLEQINRRTIPAYYQDLIKNVSCPIQQARILLDDYSKGDSVVKRILSLHWNRNHAAEASKLVALIDYGLKHNIDDLLEDIENISKNASGSLGKRWMVLFNNCKKPEERIALIENEDIASEYPELLDNMDLAGYGA